jgi:PhoPQ-activated pathogenicity-related protein
LFEFGDQKYENRDWKHDMFIHIPDTKEIISCLKKATFAVIESQFRSEIASEPQKVVDFSKECKFWVAQKI